jgi:uncharacterized cupredoxin-like copper-binding protein
MRMFPTRIAAVLVAAAGAVVLSGGCGTGQTALTGTPKLTPGSAVPGGTILAVTEREWSISTSAFTVAPGTYTVEVANHGKMSHNLNIKGPGVSNWRTATLPPGTTTRYAVNLQPGTYQLWCSIDHHRALGMEMDLDVH